MIFFIIQDFLRSRFTRFKGINTTKARVKEVIMTEFDIRATASLIGRAISKAFVSNVK